MRMWIAAAVCAATALVVVGGAGAWHNDKNVRRVSPKGNDSGACVKKACKTIGYAVGQAHPGDTIEVDAGTYAESVLVTKRLSLEGHHATIDATGHDNGVVISGADAAGTKLRGFTVENTGPRGRARDADVPPQDRAEQDRPQRPALGS